MWTIKFWKLRGCQEIEKSQGHPYDEFATREQALDKLKKRLDCSLVDAEKRVVNAKGYIQKAKDFGLYPIEEEHRNLKAVR